MSIIILNIQYICIYIYITLNFKYNPQLSILYIMIYYHMHVYIYVIHSVFMIKCSKDLFGIYIIVCKHWIALVIIGNYEALSTIGSQWDKPSTNYCRISSIHSMYLIILLYHISFSSGWGLVRINVRAPEQVASRRNSG